MTETLHVLRAARSRISAFSDWTQRQSARDVFGNAIVATSPDATCWCAIGACSYASACRGGAFYDAVEELTHTVQQIRPGTSESVAAFNDTATHDDVLELFDRTIARLDRR